jgi:hypothetical protein
MHEHLIQARDCAAFAARDLQAALAQAGPVEALVILPLIADAARLQQHIAALITAKGAA